MFLSHSLEPSYKQANQIVREGGGLRISGLSIVPLCSQTLHLRHCVMFPGSTLDSGGLSCQWILLVTKRFKSDGGWLGQFITISGKHISSSCSFLCLFVFLVKEGQQLALVFRLTIIEWNKGFMFCWVHFSKSLSSEGLKAKVSDGEYSMKTLKGISNPLLCPQS